MAPKQKKRAAKPAAKPTAKRKRAKRSTEPVQTVSVDFSAPFRAIRKAGGHAVRGGETVIRAGRTLAARTRPTDPTPTDPSMP